MAIFDDFPKLGSLKGQTNEIAEDFRDRSDDVSILHQQIYSTVKDDIKHNAIDITVKLS